MYRCCTDANGEKYGWGRVLDWIGVEWENEYHEPKQLAFPGCLEEVIENESIGSM